MKVFSILFKIISGHCDPVFEHKLVQDCIASGRGTILNSKQILLILALGTRSALARHSLSITTSVITDSVLVLDLLRTPQHFVNTLFVLGQHSVSRLLPFDKNLFEIAF